MTARLNNEILDRSCLMPGLILLVASGSSELVLLWGYLTSTGYLDRVLVAPRCSEAYQPSIEPQRCH